MTNGEWRMTKEDDHLLPPGYDGSGPMHRVTFGQDCGSCSWAWRWKLRKKPSRLR